MAQVIETTQIFFTNIFNLIEQIGNRQVVTAGDWNTVLNPSIDIRNYRNNNPRPRSRKTILENMEKFDIIDIYRKVYPTKRIYSWRKFNTLQQSRLDYILLSDTLIDKVGNVDISPGYRSDHSIVSVTLLDLQLQSKPRCYWKFNNSLLKDKTYVDKINETINNVKKQYALPVYNYDEINIIDKDLIRGIPRESQPQSKFSKIIILLKL